MKKTVDKVTIVIPTIRQDCITIFLKAWEKEFRSHTVIVIEDNPKKTFSLPGWVEHYSWKEIDQSLGRNSWIIPRRSGAIRSFGFLLAWKNKSKYIITLDDDCVPEASFKGSFIQAVIMNLDKKWKNNLWFNTLKCDIYPRGYPYKIRKVTDETVIHHGLWSNNPDLDGLTQKKNPEFRTKPFEEVDRIAKGIYFPMSGMNLGFKRRVLPAMYFLLMGEDGRGNKWPYDRFDDIWAGLFAKKICDHLNYAISSGYPSIKHMKASNIEENIKKEAPGIVANEWLWKYVDNLQLKSTKLGDSYLEIATLLSKQDNYWCKLSEAMKIWISLFLNQNTSTSDVGDEWFTEELSEGYPVSSAVG